MIDIEDYIDEEVFKKYLLRTTIVALSLSALLGIIIFLFGEFGETEAKILFTTLTLGGFSLTGLSSSVSYKIPKLKSFSQVGILCSLLGFLVTLIAIWNIISFENIWKLMFIFMVLSASFGQVSFLLFLTPKTLKVKYIKLATIFFIVIVGFMLLKSIVSEFGEGELYYRLLGVFGILDVLGTIASPIMNKMIDHQEIPELTSQDNVE